ncbi:MAG: hypothetical protein R3177_10045, partial [Arsukibacterium sp.]|nr:hypothetical protein [Arsukibacterium sp.]
MFKNLSLTPNLLSILLVAGVINSAGSYAAPVTKQLTPPVAVQQPYTVSSPHGNRQDLYYWLRDDSRTSPTVLDYLHRENDYFASYAREYQPLTEKLT